MKSNYKKTFRACYRASLTQAMVNNFAPLLFLIFQNTYKISLDKITLLITLNFSVQLCTDFICSKLIDKIGYRKGVIIAHIFEFLGMTGLAILPSVLNDVYLGLLVAVIFYAIGSGITEVLISPIVEACPSENKAASMSFLHSFYCWGSMMVIIVSALFFEFFGTDNWKILSVLWSLLPLFNMFSFMVVPINEPTEKEKTVGFLGLLKMPVFWVFFILMIMSGAAELSMSQWASAFAESGLGVSKTVGDLLGPCMFALFMGTSRIIFSKIGDNKSLLPSMFGSGILCIVSYIIIGINISPVLSLAGCALCGFSVGIMWPGMFSLSVKKIKGAATALFALLAFGGDIGCSLGPTVVGFVAENNNGNLGIGILSAVIFPVTLVIITGIFLKSNKKNKKAV